MMDCPVRPREIEGEKGRRGGTVEGAREGEGKGLFSRGRRIGSAGDEGYRGKCK